MDAALRQTAYLPPVGAVVETVRVLREGAPVAVLTSAADGSAFTVTAQVGSAAVRPYTFATATETNAFLTETADSFAYLGCDVERSYSSAARHLTPL